MTEAPEAHAQSEPNPSDSAPGAANAGVAAGTAPSEGAPRAQAESDAAAPAQPVEPAQQGEVATEHAPSATPEDAAAHETSGADEDAAAHESEAPIGEGAGETGEQAAADGTAAEPAGKRKRRRRKKGKTRSEAGEQEAAGAEATEARRKRESTAAPFLRFFTGPNAGRKHGFAVEEAVAGRVIAVANGAITIDLFGKAIAYADEHEPREVPVREPAPAEPTAEPDASSGAAESGGESADASSGSAPDAPAGAQAGTAETAAARDAGLELAAAQPAAAAQADAEASSDAAAMASAEPEPSHGSGDAAAADAAAAEAAAAEAAATDAAAADAAAAEATAADAAADAAAAEAALEGADDEGEGEGEITLSGETAPGVHGPLPPAPVVPEEFPRLEPPTVGQVFRGRVGSVSESGHIAIVNRIVQRKAVIARLETYRTQRRRVQGLVYGFNRGGFDVLVEGVRAFCPASAMALEDIEDPAQYLGQKLEFLLPASQAITKDIIVSRRSILERLQRKKARELVRSLEPGQKLKGRVTQVREFGLFVDIGGIEGLVHQSELSFAHGVRPADVAKPGDEVEVQVLRVGAEPNKREGGKRDRVARVSLSMKALQPDPWDAHADALREGSAQLGKVTRTTDFGAFVEIAPQIEGLLHITELGRDLKHANQAVKEGDEIQVVIERVDRRARRISLSKLTEQELQELQSGAIGEEAQQNVRPGSRIKVKVARVEPRGLVVRISGVLGKRARGYIPAIELPGGRGADLRKAYPVGSELEVKVVGVDRDGGLRCSPKALAIDEERKAVKDYRREASKQGFGTFGDLLRAKLGQVDPKQ